MFFQQNLFISKVFVLLLIQIKIYSKENFNSKLFISISHF